MPPLLKSTRTKLQPGKAKLSTLNQVKPYYLSTEHRQWRALVIKRAHGRCEAVDDGRRCTQAAPRHRMFADHIHEIRDGGALLDPDNGACLCGKHHTLKTAAARRQRFHAGGAG